jgi:DNA gyrase subunit B
MFREEASARETIFVLVRALESFQPSLAPIEGRLEEDEERGVPKLILSLQAGEGRNVEIGPDLLGSLEFKELRTLFPRLEALGAPPYKIEREAGAQEADSRSDLVEKIMKMARNGISIQRFKGLGEMNPEQLWETTMNPETRRLLQVTIEDAVGAEEIFSTLMGENVEERRHFIQRHAPEAKNLDI